MTKNVCKAGQILGVAWLGLALAISGISGMVLCVGADGHLALEPAHSVGCHSGSGDDHPGHPAHEDTHAFVDAGSAGCGDCIDLSLSSDTSKQVRPYRLSPPLGGRTASGALSPAAAFLVRWGPTDPIPEANSPLSPVLRAQRTIVLRV